MDVPTKVGMSESPVKHILIFGNSKASASRKDPKPIWAPNLRYIVSENGRIVTNKIQSIVKSPHIQTEATPAEAIPTNVSTNGEGSSRGVSLKVTRAWVRWRWLSDVVESTPT
eukprot:scaffold1211_cov169-Amphora_coffeaeformis.AAC.21